MNKPMGDMSKTCNCVHHKIGPWMVILIGIVLILAAFDILTSMWVWLIVGVLLVVKGGTKLNASKCNCCNHDKMMKM